MSVYERKDDGELKFLQLIDLDFMPDNPCTSHYLGANASNNRKRGPVNRWSDDRKNLFWR